MSGLTYYDSLRVIAFTCDMYDIYRADPIIFKYKYSHVD